MRKNKEYSDGISYPEKFMFSVLKQLNVEFKTQLSKSTFKWCDKYRYDFYLTNCNIFIETHGLQHYEETNISRGKGRTYEEEVANDKSKKELALSNGIKEENYIVVDCRKSELKWIKEHILESNLANIFDLSNIDWLKAEEFTCTNLIKEVCFYKNDNIELTSKEIGYAFNLEESTVRKYLKKGNKQNWCKYDAKYEMRKNGSKNGKLMNKPIIVLDLNSKFVGEFESARDLEKQSEKLFKVKMSYKNISGVCNKKAKTCHGYIIVFKDEYNPKIIIEIKNKSFKREIYCDELDMIFESAVDVVKYFKKEFNILLRESKICMVCKGKNKKHQGYMFRYADEYLKQAI